MNYKHEYIDDDVVQNHLVQMHVVVVSDSYHQMGDISGKKRVLIMI